MTQPAASFGMISPHSRRLRTLGIVLLAAVLGMAVYGVTVLMPTLKSSQATVRLAHSEPPGKSITAPARSPEVTRARRAITTKVLFAYGYWTVCGALILTLLVVAWLDFREVSRRYLESRRALWTEGIARTEQVPPDDRV